MDKVQLWKVYDPLAKKSEYMIVSTVYAHFLGPSGNRELMASFPRLEDAQAARATLPSL